MKKAYASHTRNMVPIACNAKNSLYIVNLNRDEMALRDGGEQTVGQMIDEMMREGEVTMIELNLDPRTFRVDTTGRVARLVPVEHGNPGRLPVSNPVE